ncbi:hypothetical protein [Chitinophaga sp. CF418]|uniref:hypothetical protein n=1 Tax=Chitinophaga sp. CF418 TaxID=1855287 RepID=UPI00122CE225|nr:hypothetical protein [Chitinophaga sp. CF418]
MNEITGEKQYIDLLRHDNGVGNTGRGRATFRNVTVRANFFVSYPLAPVEPVVPRAVITSS